MSRRPPPAEPVHPPRHDAATLEADRRRAVELFRTSRLEEPIDEYPRLVDEYQAVVEDLIERTVDLTRLREEGAALFRDDKTFEAFRYLAGPPISADDLEVVADVRTFVPSKLAGDPDAVARILDVVWQSIDRRRFQWVTEARDPDPDEKAAAVLASAALLATQRLQTNRRVQAKRQQELAVEEALIAAQFVPVKPRRIATIADAPERGAYCRETYIKRRKIDFVVRLRDQRLLALECKASNSYTNSVKRLNNDTAAKAEGWVRSLGPDHIVPAVVLAGAFKWRNLEDAQESGLTLFWAHRLDVLTDWLAGAR